MTHPPYYTAIPGPTIGPADPNAPARGKFYAALTVLFPLIGALATFGIMSTEQASAITAFATATLGLAGAFGFGVAAKNTNKQVNNGTFNPPPETNAFEALNQLKTQVDATVEHAKTQVSDATAVIQGAAAMIPGGALISGVFSGPVGDLIQGMADLDLNRATSVLREN
jgi:hypothetical protein